MGAALALAAAVKRLEVGEQLTEWRRVHVADDNFRAFQDLVKKDDAKAGGHSEPRGESLAEKLSRLMAFGGTGEVPPNQALRCANVPLQPQAGHAKGKSQRPLWVAKLA